MMMKTSVNKSPKRPQKKKTDTYSSCMLYDDLVKEKLQGIVLATCNPTIDDGTNFIAPDVPDYHQQHHHLHHLKHTVSDKMSCNCCSVEFASRQDQRDHYKSDWHRYNLKLKLRGLCSILEEDFEKIAGDVSSISGSEDDSDSDTETDGSSSGGRLKTRPMPIPGHVRSSSSHSGTDSESENCTWDGNARKYPKVFFKNTLGEILSVYRCLLYHKKNPPSSQSAMLTCLMALPQQARWAVLMTAGGHFAGAIFDGGTLVAHKTFHRYVVRAKRGSAQGNRDSQGNAPKSAGASLRRYNEAALAQEVQDLMVSWSDNIKKCDLIFLRAPSFNRQMFYGGKNPVFKKDNTRIRTIPFATRRPTLNEVKRVYQMLASVECYGNATDFKDFIPVSPIRHFSYETGKLEVVSEDKLKNIPWRSREKDNTSQLAASPKRPSPQNSSPRMTEDVIKTIPDHVIDDGHPSSSATSTSETELVDVELIEVEETISTLHLQEFECTKKPRKKKTKRQRRPSKHQLEPDGDVYAEEKYHLRNSLYTACKVGDAELLKNLLVVFSVMSGNKDESSDIASLIGNQSSNITNSKEVEKEKTMEEESPDTTVSDGVEKTGTLGDESPETTISKDIKKSKTQGEESLDISKDVQKTKTQVEESPNIISKDVEKKIVEEATGEINNSCNTVDNQVCDTDKMKFDIPVNLPSGDTETCDIVSDSDSADVQFSVSRFETQDHDNKNEPDNSLTNVKQAHQECSIPIPDIINLNKESDPSFDASVSDDKKSHSSTKKPSLLSTSPRQKVGGTFFSELSPLMAADILNEPFGDNETTLLHVSARSGHSALIPLLLDAGADPSVREKSGKVPYIVGSTKETRNEFRRFMAQNPDKYDYVSAQVPSPLTAEMEAEKKQKDLEKKKIQKKIKNEKMKEKKAEMAKQRKEEVEQKRFLALSDREKRALAADKRLVQQLEMKGEVVPVLSRCWQCASDMTGKIPFQYFDYKFCSTKCLQTHRKKDKS